MTKQFVMKCFGVPGSAMNPALEGWDGGFDVGESGYSFEAHAFECAVEGLLNVLSRGVQSKEWGVATNAEFVIAGGAQQILDGLMFSMPTMSDQFVFASVRLVEEMTFRIRAGKAVSVDGFGTSWATAG